MENYEKRYKQALERAKVEQETFFNLGNISAKTAIERIFPELREEDEIFKELLHNLIVSNDYTPSSKEIFSIYGKTKEDCLAWLEKQAKKKSTTQYSYVKFREGDIVQKITGDKDIVTIDEVDIKAEVYRLTNSGFIPFKYEHLWHIVEQKPSPKFMPGECIRYRGENYKIKNIETTANGFIYNVSLIGKPSDQEEVKTSIGFSAEKDMIRIEQMPADKVEPKFKVGDWIVGEEVGEECTCRVVDIRERFYKLYFQDGKTVNADIPYVDEKFRLWTIQNAKEGDVLYCKKDDDLEIIVMYLRINIHNNVDSYCRYNSKSGFNTYITNVLNAEFDFITPATKEQRNILLSKMKEVGYEWNAEKKELKKIEQNCYHNDGLYYAIDILEKTFGKVEGYQSDDGKMEHQAAIETVKALYHKKPNIWSEDDEHTLQGVIDEIQASKKQAPDYDFETYDRFLSWLKSLKDKVIPQPKQEWSEEDEKILKELVEEVKDQLDSVPSPDCMDKEDEKVLKQLSKWMDWLKSLKNRVQPQPKQKWSEENEEKEEI